MKGRISWICLLLFFLPACRAYSSAALLLEEPFGQFGFFNPTGHVAVYLSHVCASSPTHLRLCHPGEYGVVIARYHRVAGRDWLAIPLIAYLYAVDDVSEVPAFADRETEAALRDAWRRKHLEALIPDGPGGQAPDGEWIQLVGALYDRKIYVYEVDTTVRKDQALIAKLNRRANRSHFNLFFNNCADFARSTLNFYYPHAVHRSFTADLGMTTPKQDAKSLVHYASRHQAIELQTFVLPQVPGSIPRSKKVNGVLEAVLRKKYVAPLVWVEPYVAAGILVTYLARGRFDPAKQAVPLDSSEVAQSMWLAEPPALPMNATPAQFQEELPAMAQVLPSAALEGMALDGPGTGSADPGSSERNGTEDAGMASARLPAGNP